ncbi:MAG TPA: VWA domain-containing protein [Candidatus Eisenbacteria bacterium]|nr:VWA domain-containing protein [Candidatus Eisenbacteria bacterium]
MRWAAPEYFALFWIVPVAAAIVLWMARARRADEAALGDRDALRRRWGAPGRWNGPIRTLLFLLAVGAGIVALARPQAGLRLVSTTSTGPDVVVALDLSESMRARDAKPDRLGAARREIATLLRSLEGSAIGLIGFAGEARVLSPLTTDLDGLRDRIDAASPEELDEPGSDVGAAVALAGQLLRRPGDRPRAVILVTDGEQLDGDATRGLPPLRASGASLVVLGVGTPEGTTIPVVDTTGAVTGMKKDRSDHVVVTKLAEETLRGLARSAGGRYERADGSGRAGRLAAAYARGSERGDRAGRSLRAYDERFHWLAALAALLLAAEVLVPRRRDA